MCCQGNHSTGSRDCEGMEAKTYSKYHLSRSEKDGGDYKICANDKKKKKIQLSKNKAVICVKQVQPQNLRWLPNLLAKWEYWSRKWNRHRSSYRKMLQRPKHQCCNKLKETGKARQEELRGPHFGGDFWRWATTDPTQKEN